MGFTGFSAFGMDVADAVEKHRGKPRRELTCNAGPLPGHERRDSQLEVGVSQLIRQSLSVSPVELLA